LKCPVKQGYIQAWHDFILAESETRKMTSIEEGYYEGSNEHGGVSGRTGAESSGDASILLRRRYMQSGKQYL
jgi:hypothetical protein